MGTTDGSLEFITDVSSTVRRLSTLLGRGGVEWGKILPTVREMMKSTLLRDRTYVDITSNFGSVRLEVLDTLTKFEDMVLSNIDTQRYRLRYCSIDLDDTLMMAFDKIVEETDDALERYILRLEQEGEIVPTQIKRFIQDFKDSSQI